MADEGDLSNLPSRVDVTRSILWMSLKREAINGLSAVDRVMLNNMDVLSSQNVKMTAMLDTIAKSIHFGTGTKRRASSASASEAGESEAGPSEAGSNAPLSNKDLKTLASLNMSALEAMFTSWRDGGGNAVPLPKAKSAAARKQSGEFFAHVNEQAGTYFGDEERHHAPQSFKTALDDLGAEELTTVYVEICKHVASAEGAGAGGKRKRAAAKKGKSELLVDSDDDEEEEQEPKRARRASTPFLGGGGDDDDDDDDVEPEEQ
ncbi:hypothetical protein CGLO_09291 [Colletotrichum gloeosporioides Cg-14]|uniref:Uncharacterized protein n=1 Tax=Colletotrichum gloeosporioides (strain Cg-14) TaxID=1237896 RepID=T0LSI3_COLGC|nr:hypothetical protein CGLO_09291 [Colletotrichum gloeosporioides Cg-14]